MSRSDGIALAMTPENIRLSVKGLKDQTQRIIKLSMDVEWAYAGVVNGQYRFEHYNPEGLIDGLSFRKPRYLAGDLCYLTEKWAVHKNWDEYRPSEIKPGCGIWYEDHLGWKYDKNRGKVRSTRHMCRWMARRWVRITRVLDPHRIQKMTKADCIAEGIIVKCEAPTAPLYYYPGNSTGYLTAKGAFRAEWESIHGPGAWDLNHWVVPYEYVMVKK